MDTGGRLPWHSHSQAHRKCGKMSKQSYELCSNIEMYVRNWTLLSE